MSAITKIVKLQSNTRGSWRDVLEFDAADADLNDAIMNAAEELFGHVPGAKLRVIIPGDTAPLVNWTFDNGWRDWAKEPTA